MSENTLTIQLNSDKNLVSHAATTERILEIRVQAPVSTERERRPALNLALVLDRSGSMAGEKLEYVKRAASHVLDQLQEQDQVALVIYDDEVNVLAHSTKVTQSNRYELKHLLAKTRVDGSTNLAGGWLTGCKEAAQTAQDGTVNRTLLLTDGLANVGETDLEVLAKHAFRIYKDSVSTSTFGVGQGFDEHLLEAMANKGGGNFHYISSPDCIPDIFLKEFNDLIGITARMVEVRLDLPKSVEWKVLGEWVTEYKAGHLRIHLGDMLSGKLQDIYVKLQIPADINPTEIALNAKVFGQDESGKVFDHAAKIAYQFASQKEVEVAPVDSGLMERFALVELAVEADEALKLEREGQREEASRRLNASLQRNRLHLSAPTIDRFSDMSTRMKDGMGEADRKQSHFDIYKQKREKKETDE